MPKQLIFVLGGARSGKSAFAERLAAQGGRVLYVATAEALDDDMRRRIAAHRSQRPAEWGTLEEPLDLASVLPAALDGYDTCLLDCVTLWVSNLLLSKEGNPAAEREILEAARALMEVYEPVVRHLDRGKQRGRSRSGAAVGTRRQIPRRPGPGEPTHGGAGGPGVPDGRRTRPGTEEPGRGAPGQRRAAPAVMPVPANVRWASASAPGTCGELAQGMLDGIVCMVTCPIDLYSTAVVELSPGPGEISGPADSPKASRAVRATLEFLEESGTDALLRLDSPLPRGKGMASSTADVSAAIVATASACGKELSPAEIAEIALHIEPSDGVMFPGVAVFDHRKGSVARTMGPPPANVRGGAGLRGQRGHAGV